MQKLFLAAVAMAAVSLSGMSYVQQADPCAVVLCLRGAVDGQLKVPGCEMPVASYFSKQVWSPKYNASATKELHNGYIKYVYDFLSCR